MKPIYKEILREYDKDRISANNLLEKRQSLVYKKIPRIREIDDCLSQTGLSLVRKILNKEKNSTESIKKMEEDNLKLLKEKEILMLKNDFPKDFLTNIYKCNDCKDTGFVNSNKCTCFKQRIINSLYDLSNLNSVLKIENFDTFDIRYYSESKLSKSELSPRENIKMILTSSMNFVSDFGKKFDNLLFYGNSGLGKTFLCNCIAKDMLEKNVTVLYVTAPQMFKTIEDYRFNRDDMTEPEEYINMLYNSDLLIIDDLGTEVSTIVTSSELFNIINHRLLEKKPMVISTNMHPSNFEDMYSDRVTSRTFGYFKIFKFFGEDIRLIKKHGSAIN